MLDHFLSLIRSGRSNIIPFQGARVGNIALILIFVISLVGINHSAASAAGNTYYVDNTVICTNSGPGTKASPFCTLTKAVQVAVPGDTVHVLHGTYAETIYPPSGTAGNLVTFKADPGVTVTGNSAGFGSAFAISTKSYIVIDGFNVTQTKYMGIYVTNSSYITLSNNHVSYAGDPAISDSHRRGIYLSGTSYSTITGNTTDHNTCVGIMLLNSDHNTIGNNISFANASGRRCSRTRWSAAVITRSRTILPMVMKTADQSL
jgi:parallel beta-helix repeat protein